MLVLISDFCEQMEADYALTEQAVHSVCPEAQIAVEPYGTERFYRALAQADGLITAFLPVDGALLDKAPRLRYISQNAAGYSNLDLAALRDRGVSACHIVEYCTREVAEHALTLMLALNRSLPRYACDIRRGNWNYQNAPAGRTVDHKRLAVFGFGRIGSRTGALAAALGMEVVFVDPFVTEEQGLARGGKKVTKEEALSSADVIVNHMVLTGETYHYFGAEEFAQMARCPIFINVGRGGCVDESALLEALDRRQIAGAGLDVLEAENPDLASCPFVGREDVILTPHSAFYSQDSIRKLHEISGRSMGYFLSGQTDRVEGLIG